jgi:hypothetical protein
MRLSIFPAVVLAIAALALSACSENDKPKTLNPPAGSSAGAPATPSPQPSPVPGGTDRASVCAGYEKAQGEAEAKLIVVLPKVGEALADPSKAGPALAELKAVLATLDASFNTQATLAQDAQLKAAIEADLAVLRKAGSEIQAAGTDVARALAALQTDEFKALGEKVKAICGK